MNYPYVSIVVIGRNEAANLPDCFKSIMEMDYEQDRLEVIYVDTNSTDNSVEVARRWSVQIVEEISDHPSAGFARNCGLRESHHEIIHFVDGDMTVAPDYLKHAVRHLNHDSVVSVIGRVDEKHKAKNLISWILYYSWARKEPGFIEAPGAGGTFLKSALMEVGGYNPNIFRGQETELGIRLREKGYKILMIDEVMGTHDYGIKTLCDLIRFFLGMGRSFGNAFLLPSSSYLRGEKRVARNTLIQTFLLLIIIGAICITQKWILLLFLLPLFFLYILALYWNYDPERRLHAIAYYFLIYAGKPIMTIGMLSYWWKKRGWIFSYRRKESS